MALGLDARTRAATSPDDVRILTPADVSRLRPGWHNRLRADEIRELLTWYPGRSVWLPDTREYAVVAPWRHRDEIAAIQELAAPRNGETLLTALRERCHAAGDALLVMLELDDVHPPGFYARSGLLRIEEVVTYELERPVASPLAGPLRFTHANPAERPALAALVKIDHAAFPWLWQNSAEEFAAYANIPGVELFLGWQDTEPVSYLGVTNYGGWGHLDRIAVAPWFQGAGFGRASLVFAVNRLAALGARRIGLSTQRDNLRSQRLYERFGFRRSRMNDYRLYGAYLRPLTEATDE